VLEETIRIGYVAGQSHLFRSSSPGHALFLEKLRENAHFQAATNGNGFTVIQLQLPTKKSA
jgi:hypothetical protein